MQADRPERHAEVDGPRDVGEGVPGRRRHVEVHRLLGPPVAERAVLLALTRVDGEPVKKLEVILFARAWTTRDKKLHEVSMARDALPYPKWSLCV